MKKKGGETRGDIDKTMNVDMMEEEEFQEKKKDLRDNKLQLIILQGANLKRVAQLGGIQYAGGWEIPRSMNNATMCCSCGVFFKDTKIWTNSERIKERMEEEKSSGA